METYTRSQAKALGRARYFTGKPCKHGHISERATSGGNCIACQEAWWKANPDRVRAASNKWAAANKEYYRSWREANRERSAAASREWYWANREAALIRRRQYHKNNPDKVRALRRRWYAANSDY